MCDRGECGSKLAKNSVTYFMECPSECSAEQVEYKKKRSSKSVGAMPRKHWRRACIECAGEQGASGLRRRGRELTFLKFQEIDGFFEKCLEMASNNDSRRIHCSGVYA